MLLAQADNRRVALVTGANQGMGYAIAERLAAAGLRIILNGQRAAAVEAAAEKLRAGGADVVALPADVASESAVAAMFDQIGGRYGRLDILVSNAGIAPRVDGRSPRVEATPLEVWDRTLTVNLTGAFLIARGAVPLMKENQWGRIINVSSQSGRMYTGFGSAAYAASKAGLIGFSRVLAGEVGAYGITVNCISPGRIKTAMAASFAGADDVDNQYIVRTPLARVGYPKDVVGAVAFLASEEASFITGTVIDITGGFFMP